MSQTTAQLISNLVQALAFESTSSAPDNGVYLSAANTLSLATNSVDRITAGTSELVINESGASVDFRVEGDTNANLLFVDASTDRVGVGTASPSTSLHIAGTATPQIRLQQNNSSVQQQIESSGGDLVLTTDITNAVSGASNIEFWRGTTMSMLIDSSGRLLVGTSTARTDFATTPQVQVEGTDSATSSFSLTRNSNNTGRPTLFFGKSRGSSNGATNVVTDGDGLGTIEWAGGDGDQLVRAAFIFAQVDGTPGDNDMPGRLVFSTTRDGQSSPSERLRISADGTFKLAQFPATTLNTSYSGEGAYIRHYEAASGLGSNAERTLDIASCGDGSKGGNIRFFTNPNSAASATERMRITSSGTIQLYAATNSSNQAIQFGDPDGDSRGLIQYRHGTDALHIYTAGSEAAVIDSSGHLLVNTSTSTEVWGYGQGSLQLRGDYQGASASFINTENNTNSHAITLAKTRNGSILQSGDTFGAIAFSGDDGNGYSLGARIIAQVDGTPGDGDMPGRLMFQTTADGASSSTERMRITSGGITHIGPLSANAGNWASNMIGALSLGGNANYGEQALSISMMNSTHTAAIMRVSSERSNSSVYDFARYFSGRRYDASSGGDQEFQLRGDGNAYADGSWNGGGADYAEYFEWSDGNTTAEDRRGISVVLDGDNIREAVAGEEPIGVISGNPSVVGDAAWNKWNGKYLCDDFGTYIRNAEGERQLNPDYDPDVEYVSREDRPEWDCVGLMGKLRIRKGQVTGARWIKMRDISDTVEEWLVR